MTAPARPNAAATIATTFSPPNWSGIARAMPRKSTRTDTRRVAARSQYRRLLSVPRPRARLCQPGGEARERPVGRLRRDVRTREGALEPLRRGERAPRRGGELVDQVEDELDAVSHCVLRELAYEAGAGAADCGEAEVSRERMQDVRDAFEAYGWRLLEVDNRVTGGSDPFLLDGELVGWTLARGVDRPSVELAFYAFGDLGQETRNLRNICYCVHEQTGQRLFFAKRGKPEWRSELASFVQHVLDWARREREKPT